MLNLNKTKSGKEEKGKEEKGKEEKGKEEKGKEEKGKEEEGSGKYRELQNREVKEAREGEEYKTLEFLPSKNKFVKNSASSSSPSLSPTSPLLDRQAYENLSGEEIGEFVKKNGHASKLWKQAFDSNEKKRNLLRSVVLQDTLEVSHQLTLKYTHFQIYTLSNIHTFKHTFKHFLLL